MDAILLTGYTSIPLDHKFLLFLISDKNIFYLKQLPIFNNLKNDWRNPP
jgi:hypothetical protein